MSAALCPRLLPSAVRVTRVVRARLMGWARRPHPRWRALPHLRARTTLPRSSAFTLETADGRHTALPCRRHISAARSPALHLPNPSPSGVPRRYIRRSSPSLSPSIRGFPLATTMLTREERGEVKGRGGEAAPEGRGGRRHGKELEPPSAGAVATRAKPRTRCYHRRTTSHHRADHALLLRITVSTTAISSFHFGTPIRPSCRRHASSALLSSRRHLLSPPSAAGPEHRSPVHRCGLGVDKGAPCTAHVLPHLATPCGS